MLRRNCGCGYLVSALALCLALLVGPQPPVEAGYEGQHSSFRSGPKRNGRSHYKGASDSRVLWQTTTGGTVNSSPAVAADGTVYVGSGDGLLYAFSADGRSKWTYATSGEIESSPAIGSDGTIYVGSQDAYIHAISPDGSMKWKAGSGFVPWRPGSSIYSSPAIAESGGVLTTASSGVLTSSMEQSGEPEWQYLLPVHSFSSPAIDDDGTSYVGCYNGELHAVNSNGTKRWSIDLGGTISSAPAIADDGTIYTTSLDGKLCAVNKNGSLMWSYDTYEQIVSSPGIGYDGTIYVCARDHFVHAVNPDGTVKWTYYAASPMNSSPLIDADNCVYFGSNSGVLHALHSDGSVKWEIDLGAPIYSSPALGAYGTIFVGAGYSLFAVGTEIASVPEPSAVAQLCAMLAGLGITARRRRLR